MVQEGPPQGRETAVRCYEVRLWLLAALSIALLSACFTVSRVVFFRECSQLFNEKRTTKEFPHTALECMKENLTMEGKDWSCCPKNWMSFTSNCYFISKENTNWTESNKKCSAMKAHLLVINTKKEQDLVTQKLDRNGAYYIGLSDPEGERAWRWVDDTPYNGSAAFWHPEEPSSADEHCVILDFRQQPGSWGLNDIYCGRHYWSICKMMKIYL